MAMAPASEHRPAEGEGAERCDVPSDRKTERGRDRERSVGAPGDELAMRKIRKAQDGIGERDADRAEPDHAPDQEAVGKELQVHGCGPLAARRRAEIELCYRRVAPQIRGAPVVAVLGLRPAHRRGR